MDPTSPFTGFTGTWAKCRDLHPVRPSSRVGGDWSRVRPRLMAGSNLVTQPLASMVEERRSTNLSGRVGVSPTALVGVSFAVLVLVSSPTCAGLSAVTGGYIGRAAWHDSIEPTLSATNSPRSPTIVQSPSSSQGSPVWLSHRNAPSVTAAAVPVAGVGPSAVAYDALNGLLYVADEQSSDIAVVEPATQSVLSYISLESVLGEGSPGEGPNAISINTNQNSLYVTAGYTGNIWIINASSNTATGYLPVDGSSSVNYDPDAAAFDIATQTMYVAVGCKFACMNEVEVYAPGASAREVPVGTNPRAMAYDPANGYVYVANYGTCSALGCTGGGNVTVINGDGDSIVESIDAGTALDSMAYDPSDSYIFIANQLFGTFENVTIIDAATNKYVGEVGVGSSPVSVCYDAANDQIYVVNSASDNVSVISGLTDKVVGNIAVGSNPQSITYDAASGYLYVADYGSDSLAIIDGQNDTVVGAIPLGAYEAEFTESGLPYSSQWWINVTNGISYNGFGTTISFLATNGSYSYSVGSADRTYSSPGGSFSISGTNATVAVTFTLLTYPVMFSESDLPLGTGWFVNVTGGGSHSSATNEINFSESNGTYSYVVSSVNAEYSGVGGAFTVGGTAVSVEVTFALWYPVTFAEFGLPLGTNWTVTLDGVSRSSQTAAILFTIHNGSYPFAVSSVAGYTVSPSSGQVTVDGASVAVTLNFGSATGLSPAHWTLIPSSTGPGCSSQTFPSGTPPIPLTLGPGATASPDLWGTSDTSRGSGSVCYRLGSPDRLYASIDFSSAIQSGGVLGFPDIAYGPSPFGGFTTSRVGNPALPLPITLGSLGNVWGASNYTINDSSDVVIDFVYDIWLVNPESVTTNCPGSGYVEVMIWLYNTTSFLPDHSGLQSYFPSTIVTSAVEGSHLQTATWDIYWSSSNQTCGSQGTTISYVLKSGGTSESIGVPISQLLQDVENHLGSFPNGPSSASQFENYELYQISLGSEYTNPTQSGSGAAQYSFNVYAYCLLNFGFSDPINLLQAVFCPAASSSSASPVMLGPLTVPETILAGAGSASAMGLLLASWKGWLPLRGRRPPAT